jgi:hypothetical protein
MPRCLTEVLGQQVTLLTATKDRHQWRRGARKGCSNVGKD